jgi:hypothetical protein
MRNETKKRLEKKAGDVNKIDGKRATREDEAELRNSKQIVA